MSWVRAPSATPKIANEIKHLREIGKCFFSACSYWFGSCSHHVATGNSFSSRRTSTVAFLPTAHHCECRNKGIQSELPKCWLPIVKGWLPTIKCWCRWRPDWLMDIDTVRASAYVDTHAFQHRQASSWIDDRAEFFGFVVHLLSPWFCALARPERGGGRVVFSLRRGSSKSGPVRHRPQDRWPCSGPSNAGAFLYRLAAQHEAGPAHGSRYLLAAR